MITTEFLEVALREEAVEVVVGAVVVAEEVVVEVVVMVLVINSILESRPRLTDQEYYHQEMDHCH